MFLSEERIEKVKRSYDIVEMAGRMTPLHKQNSNDFYGKCPFCNDKGESFSVNGNTQIYVCFNCRRAGNVFTLYKDYHGVSSKTAIMNLVDESGIVFD